MSKILYETTVETFNHYNLVFPTMNTNAEDEYYVSIMDRDTGREEAYWDVQEWQDSPEEVLGAILGVLGEDNDTFQEVEDSFFEISFPSGIKLVFSKYQEDIFTIFVKSKEDELIIQFNSNNFSEYPVSSMVKLMNYIGYEDSFFSYSAKVFLDNPNQRLTMFKIRNCREAYDLIFNTWKSVYIKDGLSEDKSNRKAAIKSVQGAWKLFYTQDINNI